VNTYRVKLSFADGRVLYTQPESVNYFTGADFVIYPNPAVTGQPLGLLSKDPDGAIARVFSMDGRKLNEQRLSNTVEMIYLPTAKGIYLLEITRNGKRELIEKLVLY
jgi:hypothetical protein